MDIYSLVLGASLLVSPWLLASSHMIMGKDAWASGALIVGLSVAALMAFAEWEKWGVLIVGLWLVISPWALGSHSTTAMKFNIGIGILVTYLAAIELWLIHYEPPPNTG